MGNVQHPTLQRSTSKGQGEPPPPSGLGAARGPRGRQRASGCQEAYIHWLECMFPGCQEGVRRVSGTRFGRNAKAPRRIGAEKKEKNAKVSSVTLRVRLRELRVTQSSHSGKTRYSGTLSLKVGKSTFLSALRKCYTKCNTSSVTFLEATRNLDFLHGVRPAGNTGLRMDRGKVLVQT